MMEHVIIRLVSVQQVIYVMKESVVNQIIRRVIITVVTERVVYPRARALKDKLVKTENAVRKIVPETTNVVLQNVMEGCVRVLQEQLVYLESVVVIHVTSII
jgi:hypothetical protein